jgi:hypothetical protein
MTEANRSPGPTNTAMSNGVSGSFRFVSLVTVCLYIYSDTAVHFCLVFRNQVAPSIRYFEKVGKVNA